MTRLPSPTRNATDSAIIRRFSSGSTFVTFSRWSDHVLPTSVQTGAKQSASRRSAGSSSARESRRRVIPNAATCAVSKLSPERRSNSASSFGFEAGKPASIKCTPSESSACATRTFSSTDSDMPSPCMPSRRVVS
jgi:hypothetical protein